MLLNKISLLFASSRVTAVDYEKGVVVVETQGGALKAVPFNVTTLEIKS